MRKMLLLCVVASAAAVVGAATPVASAPLNALPRVDAVERQSDVQKVYRRCWRHRGHWHCRRYGWHRRPYYNYGGYPLYRRHHYGPRFGVWGPGFGLYIGPRHRHWW
jgi:hypothetical protein